MTDTKLAPVEPLSCAEIGSFAEFTMKQRLPALVAKITATNPSFAESVKKELAAFELEIKNNHSIRPPTVLEDGGDNWIRAWLRIANGESKDGAGESKDGAGDDGAALPDAAVIRSAFARLQWQAVPWFVAEMYLFRVAVEISGYWSESTRGLDPFLPQKMEELKVGSEVRL